jgi:hypothetical protein
MSLWSYAAIARARTHGKRTGNHDEFESEFGIHLVR